jgi:predicted transcriptional regulator
MDILGNLLDGPKRPTRLAQLCNLSFDNLMRYAGILVAKGLVQVTTEESHELYSITPAGFEMHRQYRKFWEALYPSEGWDTHQ